MKKRGFTLIELLIVVAIIAILAAIAVPNFLEAQTRSKVSRVKSDQRSLATGIETYYVDNNEYPAMTHDRSLTMDGQYYGPNWTASGDNTVGRTFRARHATQLLTMTTPIAYLTSIFGDPFADAKGSGFRYYTDVQGWILGSWGPDVDQAAGGDLGWNMGSIDADDQDIDLETVYSSAIAQPSRDLIASDQSAGNSQNQAFTYDPTNGTISPGDVWRTKQ